MNFINNEIMQKKKNGIIYLQFKKLLKYKNFVHAYVIDLNNEFEANSKTNLDIYKDFCNVLNLNYNYVVKPIQKHTNNVITINKKINKDKPDINLDFYNSVDGIITNKPNLVLTTTNVESILMLFYDPVKNVIANINSGWRGTLNKISVNTVRKMKSDFNCNSKDIICCIFPNIRKCNFEVGIDVKEMFESKFKDILNLKRVIKNNDNNKWNIDIVLINKILLKKEGLLSKNIIDCNICNYCKSDFIHSYKASKDKTSYKLEAAVICLKEE